MKEVHSFKRTLFFLMLLKESLIWDVREKRMTQQYGDKKHSNPQWGLQKGIGDQQSYDRQRESDDESFLFCVKERRDVDLIWHFCDPSSKVFQLVAEVETCSGVVYTKTFWTTTRGFRDVKICTTQRVLLTRFVEYIYERLKFGFTLFVDTLTC